HAASITSYLSCHDLRSFPTRRSSDLGTEFEDGAVVFFDMNDDLILALWPKKSLAKDSKMAVSPSSPTEFSLGHNVKSKQEVDARSEEHTSELQSRVDLVCRLLLEKKK